MQMMGTAIGAAFNYVMVNNIITNQFDALISIEGTNVWSGQQAQAFNSLAVTWGGLSHELFLCWWQVPVVNAYFHTWIFRPDPVLAAAQEVSSSRP